MSSNKRPRNPTNTRSLLNNHDSSSDTNTNININNMPPRKKQRCNQISFPTFYHYNIHGTQHRMLLQCKRAAKQTNNDNYLHPEMNDNNRDHNKEISSWSIQDYENINTSHYLPEEYHIDYITEGCHQSNKSITTTTAINNNNDSNNNNLNQHEMNYFITLAHYNDYPNTNYLVTTSLSQSPYKPKIFEFISQCAAIKLYQSELKVQSQLEEYKSMSNRDKDSHGSCLKNTKNHDNDPSNIDEIYHSFFQNYNFEETIQQWQNDYGNNNNKNNQNKDKSKKKKTKRNRKKVKPKQNSNQNNVTTSSSSTNATTMTEYYNQQLKDIQNLYHNFDETAMITLGYIIQECMVRTFLPLATFHVKRCHYLEVKKSSKKCSSTSLSDDMDGIDYDPFVQWTLPPDKAIINFCHDESLSSLATDMSSYYLPSSSISSMRRSYLKHNNSKNIVDDIISSTLSSNGKHKNHFTSWCNIHGLDKKFVLDNIDLFQFLIDDYQYDVNNDEDLMSWQRSKVDDEVDIRMLLAKACVSKNNTNTMNSGRDDGNDKEIYWPIPPIIH
jgi:hypothetical protein